MMLNSPPSPPCFPAPAPPTSSRGAIQSPSRPTLPPVPLCPTSSHINVVLGRHNLLLLPALSPPDSYCPPSPSPPNPVNIMAFSAKTTPIHSLSTTPSCPSNTYDRNLLARTPRRLTTILRNIKNLWSIGKNWDLRVRSGRSFGP